ncbi:hypothetical protein ABIC08_009214, partial [Bradyrhizobium sp. RT9b]
RVVRHMETAATRHADKISVKRQSKGPQRYAYTVTILVGLTALIAYAAGRHDGAPVGPSSAPAVASRVVQPVALVEAPQEVPAKTAASPSPLPQPAAKPTQLELPPPKPDGKRKVEVALTAAAIAAIIVKASRERYDATGHPCACPDDLTNSGRACGGRSAYSRPGGAAPLCYPTDVTAAMIDDYRKTVPR